MRIAFIYDIPYPWHIGGIEMLNYNEAVELAKHHEVHFFTLRWPGMKETFRHKDIIYHTFRSVTQEKVYRHGRRSIREAVFFSAGLFRLLAHGRFDAIVANEFPVLHLIPVKLYCRLTGCKLILEVAEVWDRDYWVKYIGPVAGDLAMALSTRLLKNADMYVSVSTATTEKLAELGILRDKIEHSAPAVDDRVARSAKASLHGKPNNTVIFSGRFIKEKRIDKFVEVVEKAREFAPGTNGLVIGDGPEHERIRRLIKSRKLDRAIRLRPFYREKADFYKELGRSGLLLHMSEREGLGIVAIESIILGVPVVLPYYTPMPVEIKEMCVIGDEQDLPRKVAEILRAKDRSRYISNTQNAKRFLISSIVPTFNGIFRKLGLKG